MNETKRMYRFEVPADDEEHTHWLNGDPVAVAATADNDVDIVEFWSEYDPLVPTKPYRFEVFGTGHPIPKAARWIGTAPRTRFGLVYHLYDVSEVTG